MATGPKLTDDWVSRAPSADLELVAQALDAGRLSLERPSFAALQSLGLDAPADIGAFLARASARDPRAVAWCLRLLAQERRAASERLARCAQLVWSGHEDGSQPLRDTREVLAEVCARAERQVTLATYVIHDGRHSLEPLARRMYERPELKVDLYVDVKPAGSSGDVMHHLSAWMARFRERHWPEGVRLPSLWYDPLTLDREAGVSLHAKCVVVDERWAFITSANFTEAAQARNLEVGVLLDHPHLARSLQGQFQSLRDRGTFRRIPET